MRHFLENEMEQLMAGQVHTDVIQQKLGEIEEQVVRLLDKVRVFSSLALNVYMNLSMNMGKFQSRSVLTFLLLLIQENGSYQELFPN